ncbi:MAG: peptide chain release factor N(5)-glutamine methyltransferase [Magnetococcales bacterium]|nr:peptide chain release factor N(5)-glutamine methyltransferase [Magnetococcales bacterium]
MQQQEPTSEQWTTRTLLSWATTWLTERGCDAPRLDSELLLADALGLRRLDLFLDPQRPLTPDELATFKPLLQRRGRREPVAHILQRREFWKGSFHLEPGVLVPRPDTEILVETALERWPEPMTDTPPFRLLDLGVGSGVLLLSVLQERPDCVGTGVDLSETALRCTADNAQRLDLAERVTLLAGDWFQPIGKAERFHTIVGNPPYISDADYATLEPEVRDWEDALALRGGPDGLEPYRALIPEAVARLHPGGLLALEIGEAQGEEVAALFTNNGLSGVEIRRDYGDHDRVVVGTLPKS